MPVCSYPDRPAQKERVLRFQKEMVRQIKAQDSVDPLNLS